MSARKIALTVRQFTDGRLTSLPMHSVQYG